MIAAAIVFALAGCEQRSDSSVGDQEDPKIPSLPTKIDYSLVMPEKQDGEFFRSARQDPYRKVSIDLRNPTDSSGIPEVKWFPMGHKEFCAIQGTTDLTLILPSGRVITEEFNIVYVDRDSQGIFQVKADSLGWLKLDVAEKRLDREMELMIEDGLDKQSLETQRESVRTWLNSDHASYGTSMRSAIGSRAEAFRFSFGFAVTMNIDHGISYRYTAELPRSKERRNGEQDAEQDIAPDR